MNSKTNPAEIAQAINEFGSQAEDIVTAFANRLDNTPPPDRIYHYTDGVGLRGILKTGKLWFTDIFNLNDPSELSYGLKTPVEEAQQLKEAGEAVECALAEQLLKMLSG